MKKALKTTSIIVVVAICVSVVLGYALWDTFERMNTWYITEDVAEYGIIQGNAENEIPEKFIKSFFPEYIEPYFENVTYQYKALNWCSYNCEIYLEFTIEDREIFHEFVDDYTKGITAAEFAYDPAYDDYVISNDLYIDLDRVEEYERESQSYYLINGAKMGRILVNEDRQQIIFTAICVTGCCGGYTGDYDFYTRFDIDPLEYSERFCEK